MVYDLFLFHRYECFMSVCLCTMFTTEARRGYLIPWSWSPKHWLAMWVLGAKLQASVRATSPVNCGALSLGPLIMFPMCPLLIWVIIVNECATKGYGDTRVGKHGMVLHSGSGQNKGVRISRSPLTAQSIWNQPRIWETLLQNWDWGRQHKGQALVSST